MVAEQSTVFLYAMLIGTILSFVYDVFRIVRKVITFPKKDEVLIGVEDAIFWVICAGVTFAFLIQTTDGKIRAFVLIGEIIGGTIHHYTLGILAMKISDKIIKVVKFVANGICSLTYKIFIKPIMRVILFGFFKIKAKISKIDKSRSKKEEKPQKKHKYHLKKHNEVLYNRIGIEHRNKAKKNARKKVKSLQAFELTANQKQGKNKAKGAENCGTVKIRKKNEKKNKKRTGFS